jgi:hypothetical protein
MVTDVTKGGSVQATTSCAHCGRAVENDAHVYHEITGWELPRGQGGANSIHLRRRTGSVMHFGCMEQLKMQQKRGPLDEQLF